MTAFCLEAEICWTQQESHASEITDAKEPGMDGADVGRQPGCKMLFALCLASAVEGPRAKGHGWRLTVTHGIWYQYVGTQKDGLDTA